MTFLQENGKGSMSNISSDASVTTFTNGGEPKAKYQHHYDNPQIKYDEPVKKRVINTHEPIKHYSNYHPDYRSHSYGAEVIHIKYQQDRTHGSPPSQGGYYIIPDRHNPNGQYLQHDPDVRYVFRP